MALTAAENARILYHLGYPGITEGLPMPPMVVALANLRTELEAKARELLAGCDAAEAQMATALTRMKASVVGSITLNAREQQALEDAYRNFQRRLANLTDTPIYADAAGGHGGIMVERSW